MREFVIKSPEGRIVVVASRQKFKYEKIGYISIGRLDISNEEVKRHLNMGYTKEEIFAMGVKNRIKLEKKFKNGKEGFYTV